MAGRCSNSVISDAEALAITMECAGVEAARQHEGVEAQPLNSAM